MPDGSGVVQKIMSAFRSSLRPPAAAPVGVVIVDADPGQRRAIAAMISQRSAGRFVPRAFATPAEARQAVGSSGIVIADIETVGGPASLRDFGDGNSLIAISSGGSINAAVAALKAGAADFLVKPIGAKALLDRLESAFDTEPTPAPAPAPATAVPAADFCSFVGTSPAMLAVYEQITRMAPSRAPVFVTGESGTGKELCAEAIHALADPASTARPFIAINCSAIPKDLMESEIFGHVRGAFTGATENRAGAAELADGGTLFLDEIAEMDLGLQAKLLRFLQSGTVRRVGGSETKRVDVRIVCATNRDPEAEIGAGRLRPDLYYRLHVLPIHLPPLRARGGDIARLAQSFLARISTEEGRRFAGLADDALQRLAGHPWPGNVRELANVIRRAVVLHDGDALTAAMLPDSLGRDVVPAPAVEAHAAPEATVRPFHEAERTIIEQAIAAFDGNIAQAAAALCLSPSTVYRKRQAWLERQAPLA